MLELSNLSLGKASVRIKVPAKVASFTCTTVLGKILNIDNLQGRNITVIEWCCKCKNNGEPVDHLPLNFDIARELWSLTLVLFGVQYIMPKWVIDLLACWKGCFGRHHSGDIWNVIRLCIMRTIQKGCTSQTFEGIERAMTDLK